MVVLRATQKVLKLLPQSVTGSGGSDTALGDWYVNRVVVDRQPLLLMVSSRSLLAILEPARNVKTLPDRIAELVADRLTRLGIHYRLIEFEARAMESVAVCRTRDRSVTGTLVDFAKALPYYLPCDGWDDGDLRLAEDRFAETPCRCARSIQQTVWPSRMTASLLSEHWQSPRNIH